MLLKRIKFYILSLQSKLRYKKDIKVYNYNKTINKTIKNKKSIKIILTGLLEALTIIIFNYLKLIYSQFVFHS